MHDNRWEGEKEQEKEDKPKRQEKPKKKEEVVEEAKPPTTEKVRDYIKTPFTFIDNSINLQLINP